MQPCANGATCLDGVNRFSCVCPAGFSGRFCTVNLDDCTSEPCQNGARCLDRAAGFRCVCPPGFVGATCERSLRALPGRDGGGQESGAAPRLSDGERLLKVTLRERSGAPGGLSQVQLLVLLLMAAATVAAVALTAGLVLQRRCRRSCGRGPRRHGEGGAAGEGKWRRTAAADRK